MQYYIYLWLLDMGAKSWPRPLLPHEEPALVIHWSSIYTIHIIISIISIISISNTNNDNSNHLIITSILISVDSHSHEEPKVKELYVTMGVHPA